MSPGGECPCFSRHFGKAIISIRRVSCKGGKWKGETNAVYAMVRRSGHSSMRVAPSFTSHHFIARPRGRLHEIVADGVVEGVDGAVGEEEVGIVMLIIWE